MKIEKINNTAFRVTLEKWAKGRSDRILCISDAHLDNRHCDRRLLRRHLDEAKATGAMVIFNGDTFCAMQGKWDRRANQDELIPELQGNNYLDKLVDYHYEFFRNYAGQIIAFGHGNHETSIIRHHQTSLIDRLIQRLRQHNPDIHTAGYVSMWSFMPQSPKGRTDPSLRMLVYHGAGGGAFVTKGTIDANRIAASYPDMDLVWIGHKHNEFMKTEPRVRWTDRGVQYIDEQVCFMTPGYKQELDFETGQGWMLERTPSPKTQGGAWLTLRHGNPKGSTRLVWPEILRAK